MKSSALIAPLESRDCGSRESSLWRVFVRMRTLAYFSKVSQICCVVVVFSKERRELLHLSRGLNNFLPKTNVKQKLFGGCNIF